MAQAVGKAGSSLGEPSKSEQKCWDKLWAPSPSAFSNGGGMGGGVQCDEKESNGFAALAGSLALPGCDVRRGDGPTRLLVTYTWLWLADDRDE